MHVAGVPGGPIIVVRRVTIEVDVVGSSPARNYFLQIVRPKVRERESAKFDTKRREVIKPETSENAEPYYMCAINMTARTAGGRRGKTLVGPRCY